MSEHGPLRLCRSTDGYYAFVEFAEKCAAVACKAELHHCKLEWVVRKEVGKSYSKHEAATGLKMDYLSRTRALELLEGKDFPPADVDGGYDAVLAKPIKGIEVLGTLSTRTTTFSSDFQRIPEGEGTRAAAEARLGALHAWHRRR